MKKLLSLIFALALAWLPRVMQAEKTPYVLLCDPGEGPAARYILYFTNRDEVFTVGDSFTPAGSATQLTIENMWSGEEVVNLHMTAAEWVESGRDASSIPGGDLSLNSGSKTPGWSLVGDDDNFVWKKVKKVVIEESFHEVTPTSCFYWFGNDLCTTCCYEIEGLGNLNMSECVSIGGMFWGYRGSNLTGYENWDMHNCLYACHAFDCPNLTGEIDLSNWNLGSRNNFYRMFMNCPIESVKLGAWDFSGTYGFPAQMFINCVNLESVDLSGVDFGGPTNASLMFKGCTALKSVKFGRFSTSSWNPSKTLDFSNMFQGCTNLESVTFTDVSALLANKECAADILNNLKTVSSDAQIVLDGDVTPSQLEFFREILGTENVSIADGQSLITDISVKIGSLGKTTLYSPYDLDFTDSPVKAYIATAFIPDGISGTLTATRIKQVPANTGVLLVGSAGTYTIPTSMSTIIISNMFRGTADAITNNGLPQKETVNGVNSTNYYFASDGAFYSVASTGRNLGAGKAYLTLPSYMLPASATAASAPIRIVFDDMSEEATGIDAPLNGNGEMTGENVYYNLNGQRVEKLSKGIYVKNGKKVLVK